MFGSLASGASRCFDSSPPYLFPLSSSRRDLRPLETILTLDVVAKQKPLSSAFDELLHQSRNRAAVIHVILPLNINESHWVLAIHERDLDNQSLSVYDSLMLPSTREALQDVGIVGTVLELPPNAQSRDSTDCGIFCIGIVAAPTQCRLSIESLSTKKLRDIKHSRRHACLRILHELAEELRVFLQQNAPAPAVGQGFAARNCLIAKLDVPAAHLAKRRKMSDSGEHDGEEPERGADVGGVGNDGEGGDSGGLEHGAEASHDGGLEDGGGAGGNDDGQEGDDEDEGDQEDEQDEQDEEESGDAPGGGDDSKGIRVMLAALQAELTSCLRSST